MNKCKQRNDEVITFEEETCFYLYWFCKFLINSSSKRVVTYYLPIAVALANRHKVALGPFFLGSVYRTMFLATTKPKESIGGPLWFIQLWAYAYFPQLAPKPNLSILDKCVCYLFAVSIYESVNRPNFGDWFNTFADKERVRSLPSFLPFAESKFTCPEMDTLN